MYIVPPICIYIYMYTTVQRRRGATRSLDKRKKITMPVHYRTSVACPSQQYSNNYPRTSQCLTSRFGLGFQSTHTHSQEHLQNSSQHSRSYWHGFSVCRDFWRRFHSSYKTLFILQNCEWQKDKKAWLLHWDISLASDVFRYCSTLACN